MTDGAEREPGRRFAEGMRVLVVAGIPSGALVVGGGSRLAMLLLRLTSPDRVHGIVSDDGFVIGRVTLAGTYNLLLLGSVVGMIGAAAYQMVTCRLIGPRWFRRATTGLASAAVVGSMLIHSDGIDFTLLKPAWLAVGLFIALPGVFGVVIGWVVDSVSRTDSWTARGRRRWLLPLICVACFPPSVVVVATAAVVFGLWVLVSGFEQVQRVRRLSSYALAVRAIWLVIAAVGLVALIDDTRALATAL